MTETLWGAYVAQRLAELESGAGDFTGLRQPAPAVVEHARQVAAESFRPDTPTPSVVPTEDGEVAFTWHRNKHDAVIEVGEPGTEAWLWAHNRASGEMWSGTLADHRGCCLERLLDAIADLRPASMLQPVTFDDTPGEARTARTVPVDESGDDW